MKYLVSYNESNKFLRVKNIIEDIKDICLEIQDKGFTFKIEPSNDIKMKVMSLQGDTISDKGIPFYVEIEKFQGYRHIFKIGEVSDVIQRLIDYMNSNGFKSIVQIPTKHHVNQLALLNITNPVSNDSFCLQDFIDQKVVSVRITFSKQEPDID